MTVIMYLAARSMRLAPPPGLHNNEEQVERAVRAVAEMAKG